MAVVAPSGPVTPEVFSAGVAALREDGVQVKIMPHAAGKDGLYPYLSASVEERRSDLVEAWLDPEVDLVMCARGGFGSAQLLPELDFELLKQRDLPVVGFSDITALHWAMISAGTGTPVAGVMLSALPRLDDALRGAMADAIACRPRTLGTFTVVKEGEVSGLPLPGNLTVAASLAGTPSMPDTTGRIVIFEDVNEPDYRVDRMLTQLEQCGVFSRCAGAIFGEFSGAENPRRLIERISAGIDGPVLCDFPFGHGKPFPAINFRQKLQITASGMVSAL